MSIIVLEGCDCVGKTTFANKLAERTGFEIVKGSSFEISELGADGMFEHMMGLLDRKNIIIDRFFYSNLVYGLLYQYPMMTAKQYAELTKKLNKTALVVYLHTDRLTIEERMKNRGDDMIKIDEIPAILKQYKLIMTSDSFSPKTMIALETSDSNFNVATAMVGEMVDLDLTKIYIKNT